MELGNLLRIAASSYKSSEKRMIDAVRHEWEKALFEAWKKSRSKSKRGKFKDLGAEQASRASYFVEIASLIERLGLANPHEAKALSIEPTHPFSMRDLESGIGGLPFPGAIRERAKQWQLSLLSLPMLDRYTEDSEVKRMRAAGFKDSLYLLDPLYGFAFIRQGEQIRNHCFAIDIWSTHLDSMPRQLASQLWDKRSDNMLSGGALAGRSLFKSILSEESDPVKCSTVPVLNVHSEKEFRSLVQQLRGAELDGKGVELWFRGQRRDYLTPDRSSLVKLGISPYSNIRDSDFTPSLYRKYDQFLNSRESYNELVLELAEWVHLANDFLPEDDLSSSERSAEGVATPTKQGLSSYQRGLLLQQYGAPSAYLDITSDPMIAAWFATHDCTNVNGKMSYRASSWNSSNSREWPTIFVFPLVKGLHPYLDIDSIMKGSEALRPSRQKCGLLGGAGNLARNYCARYLGLKIRLGPGFKPSNPILAEELFPSESEDRILNALKGLGMDRSGRKFMVSEIA